MVFSRRSLVSRFAALITMLALGALAAPALAQNGEADDQAEPPPEGTVQTASYGLFPIEGSGVQAQLQVSSRAEGGVRIVLTASGMERGRELAAAIYEGDCGPDRPLVLALTPVGSLPDDPFVSITEEEELAFEELTEGDHFVYLFAEDAIDRPDEEGLDVPALACGEVGAGANR